MKDKVNYSTSALDRRKFISMAGIGATALTMSSRFAFAVEQSGTRKIRLGIVGGGFGTSFYFHEHPNCIVEAVSDLRQDRRDRLMKVYKCNKSYESLEKLLTDPKIEAVFMATPVPDHARHVIATLKAGKHALCTVPVAMTLEECSEILNTVKSTGLTYMMAETSVYRQNTIQARIWYREGLFGNIFSAEAEYYHPGISNLWFDANRKPTWRQGQPPMNYPTHATSFLISVTGERCTSVSCLGWGDDDFLLKNNVYNNPFWNETALFKTNRGTAFRVQLLRKGAILGTERGEWHGSKMSFYSQDQNGMGEIVVKASERKGIDEGGFTIQEPVKEAFVSPLFWKTDMLPESLRHDSGHGGSHTFITHEFIDSLINNRQPEVNIYEAIAYTAPGIVAHQSALKGGECMTIPGFDS
jgi:predicted dehydrogenase